MKKSKLKHYGEPILSQMISTHLEIKSRRMLWSLDVIELNKRIADLTSQNQLLYMLKQQGLVDSDVLNPVATPSQSSSRGQNKKRAASWRPRAIKPSGRHRS